MSDRKTWVQISFEGYNIVWCPEHFEVSRTEDYAKALKLAQQHDLAHQDQT